MEQNKTDDEAQKLAEKRTVSPRKKKEHHIVAIGASAGGLEALSTFFDNTIHDSASYVIIQHLSPDYKSLMKELLARHTTLKIVEAKDGLEVVKNHIYVMPGDKFLTIKDKKLVLENRPEKGERSSPINLFFEALAKDMGRHAIGIILSGAGSDGTKGIKAIKNAGGMVMAQEPVSAAFDGMPASAINSGCVDIVSTPEMMSEEIDNYISYPNLLRFYNDRLNARDEALLLDILSLVRNQTNRDFTFYKRATIIRRLKRRMLNNDIEQLDEYRNLLYTNPMEVEALCNDFLISVTRFFRDSEAFHEIKKTVLPALFENKKAGEQVKIWVCGCCTGEEAYSIAILAREYMEAVATEYDVKIFATDIDKSALEHAGKGIFQESITHDVPASILKNYFVKNGHSYTILPVIRKMLIFAEHDIINDPPFGKIDLITCRNLLIYLNPATQKKILSTFHYSLVPDGFLFLGTSESVGEKKNDFVDIVPKWKIYKNMPGGNHGWLTNGDYSCRPISSTFPSAKLEKALSQHGMLEFFSNSILEEFGSAGVVIDENSEIVKAFGNFKKFLHLPDKNLSLHLLKMVPEDLSIALGTAIQKINRTREKLTVKSVKIRDGDRERNIDIFLKPLQNEENTFKKNLILVLFIESKEMLAPLKNQEVFDKGTYFHDRIADLELELKNTKESLQATMEQMETTNEELQSANEELLSANEELQSTNEELQSLNEELHTVNNEHRAKINDLIELNNDLDNYFRASEIGQVFVDMKLILRKFTPASAQLINIIPNDIGRPLDHLSININYEGFTEKIKSVIAGGPIVEKEVQSKDKRWFIMRIMPYLNSAKKIGGAIITFMDITKFKELNFFVSGVLESSHSGIMAFSAIRDKKNAIRDFRLIVTNAAGENLIGNTTGPDGEPILLKKLPAFKDDVYFNMFVAVTEQNVSNQFEYHHLAPNIDRWYSCSIVKMDDGFVLTFHDTTDRKNAEIGIEKYVRELMDKNSMLEQWASLATNELKAPLRAVVGFTQVLKKYVDKNGSEEAREMVTYIQEGNDQMQAMINNLLEYTQIDSSNRPRQFINAGLVIRYGKTYIFDIIKKTNAAVIYDHEMPEICGDVSQLSVLFQQLIANAIKFTKPGEIPEVHIGVEDKDTEWQFYVRDFGVGIDMKFREKIFNVLNRMSEIQKYPGHGIGLAICKRIVQRHNGKIWVESETGQGSTFYFTLPKISETQNYN